jgi:hypothetical protein
VGWSPDGKFAYRSQWYAGKDAFGYTLKIFNAVTDTVIEENQMSLKSPGGYEYDEARDKHAILLAWNALLAKHRITGAIADLVEEIHSPLTQFPFTRYDAWFNIITLREIVPVFSASTG